MGGEHEHERREIAAAWAAISRDREGLEVERASVERERELTEEVRFSGVYSTR